jgi:hypothetical protein
MEKDPSLDRFLVVLVNGEDEFIYLLNPKLWKKFSGYIESTHTDECAAISHLYEVYEDAEIKASRCRTLKDVFELVERNGYRLRDGAVGVMY